jgi:hypothetical protein
MNLNVAAWKPEDIRPTLSNMQYKLMDFSTGKYKWLTMEEIEEAAKADHSFHTKLFTAFLERASARAEAVHKIMSEGFEKRFLKKYNNDKFYNGEIVEFLYGSGIVSAPRLMMSLAFNDFFHATPSWGIEDDILIDAKKLGVEDIYLIDDYNSIHFITTMRKFNVVGESMSWGKTYLPLKHFEIYKYGDKIPSYEKHLKGIKVHENNTRD